jgi:HAD superfamily hydrolase (TIGR01549 family)
MPAPKPPAAILFDWGETLVCIPGMIHSAEHHLACVEKMYCAVQGEDGMPPAERYGVEWPAFRAAYVAEVARQLAWSAETRREHTFEDRLAGALSRLGVTERPMEELAKLVACLSEHIVAEAVLIDGAQEVIPLLADQYRLGIVSNYPYAPCVARTMERFGLLAYFSAIVVSGELGWLKPHPSVYQEALRRMDVTHERTVFVGDDLVNDVKGPKALGMRTVWFAPGKTPGDDPDVDTHITDLRELASVVSRAFSFGEAT